MSIQALASVVVFALNLPAAPLAGAQQGGNIPRVGVLEPTSQERPAPCIFAFQHGLRDLGYVEGQNILLDYRYGEEKASRLAGLAAELVELDPDVLWLHTNAAAQAARQATSTIPIVVGVSVGLVQSGLVASIARPGGNLTGLELPPSKVSGKRLELLKEAVPSVSRVALLVDPAWRTHAAYPGDVEPEARALGVELQRVEAGSPENFDEAFGAMTRAGANGLMIMESALFAVHRKELLALAVRHGLPTMSFALPFAESGSLLAYGVDPREMCRRSAVFVDKILQGARADELPIERVNFQLIINLGTAAKLGLTISPQMLYRADAVIRGKR